MFRRGVQRVVRDAVALAYHEAASGPRPLLFVRGRGCDHTYYTPRSNTAVAAAP
jgi:hypothetical protein